MLPPKILESEDQNLVRQVARAVNGQDIIELYGAFGTHSNILARWGESSGSIHVYEDFNSYENYIKYFKLTPQRHLFKKFTKQSNNIALHENYEEILTVAGTNIGAVFVNNPSERSNWRTVLDGVLAKINGQPIIFGTGYNSSDQNLVNYLHEYVQHNPFDLVVSNDAWLLQNRSEQVVFADSSHVVAGYQISEKGLFTVKYPLGKWGFGKNKKLQLRDIKVLNVKTNSTEPIELSLTKTISTHTMKMEPALKLDNGCKYALQFQYAKGGHTHYSNWLSAGECFLLDEKQITAVRVKEQEL